ncbi:MAG: DUF2309 domain-containing protein [Flavobacteriia bacterium]|nr:DUF2309 domain-containing protein [Flavobacteriia bacterium]
METEIKQIIEKIGGYLPSQSPLKDFIHHNTLHAFQNEKFHDALSKAAQVFGYQVYLTLEEYRSLFQEGKIQTEILKKIIDNYFSSDEKKYWYDKCLNYSFNQICSQEIGLLRNHWKSELKINLDKYVHPMLFKTVGSFLDQGISISNFPYCHLNFLSAILMIEKNSFIGFFKSKKVKKYLFSNHENLLSNLLEELVGNKKYYERYLFDLLFAHPGWSGMVRVIEKTPNSLLDRRKITLYEFICFELMLELDYLETKKKKKWKSLSQVLPPHFPNTIFNYSSNNELFQTLQLWQEAYEWTYYNQLINAFQIKNPNSKKDSISFQAVFCIDDRCCSFRRHIEKIDKNCQTFSTAGFFNIPFYFQPESGKFLTKSCPAPLNPQHIVKEHKAVKRHKKNSFFQNYSHGFLYGFLVSHTLGIFSALKLSLSILFPYKSSIMVSSFKHMDPLGKLKIEFEGEIIDNLKLGFEISEMAEKVEELLKEIGLQKKFSKVVYIIGHGSSSTNNTHYAGYDCGACSGRAGSVNARVAASMLNNKEVRFILKDKGIEVPNSTHFIGGLFDTSRDEIQFYDLEGVEKEILTHHNINVKVFSHSLVENAKERARRFLLFPKSIMKKQIHKNIKLRSQSIFEPRPEWNHAGNTLCLIGKRENTSHLFLDRRAFLNSYNYELDKNGDVLLSILNAVAPVCGGINLEYYFSKNDNYRLGAGSKLPHNVMGLIGVANGIEGDLRTGLPMQMVNIHNPMRLLISIEQTPELTLNVLQRNEKTYQWFKNEWINLIVIHPITNKFYRFCDEKFIEYRPIDTEIKSDSMDSIYKNYSSEDIPVFNIV